MSFGGAPPRDRAMGTGSAGCETRETRDHDYADAQRRGSHPVTLSAGLMLVRTETTGALSPTFDRALRELGKHARAPTTHDSVT